MKSVSKLIHIYIRIIFTSILCILSCDMVNAAEMPVFVSLPEVGSLLTSTVYDLHRDTKGFLWIGTEKELVVYDGYNALNASIYDDNNRVRKILSIEELDDGTILVGTDHGVYIADFSNVGGPAFTPVSDSGSEVWTMAQIPSGEVLIGDMRSLKVSTPGLDDIRDTDIIGVKINDIVATDKVAYIGTDKGVYAYDYATRVSGRITPDSLDVSAMVRDRDNLYIATRRDGLTRLNLNTGKMEVVFNDGTIIMDLAKDSAANIYVATDGDGLLKYDSITKSIENLETANGLDDNFLRNKQVYSLMIDDDDRIYVGLYMAGVEYAPIVRNQFSNYYVADDKSMSVRALCADGKNLIIGTRNGAYYVDSEFQNIKRLNRDRLGSRLVLAVDKVGDKYYLGTYGGGMSVYNPATDVISRIADAPELASGDVFSIDTGNTGNKVWVSSSSGIYCLVDDKVVNRIDKLPDGTNIGTVYEVYTDSKDNLWVCTPTAIYNMSQDGKLVLNKEIKADDVRQVMETRSHYYWFVTNSGKLEIYNADFKPTPLTDKLKNLTGARGVAEDMDGNVWITSDNGVFKYSPRYDILTQYLNAHGLKSPVFNSGKPVRGEDGLMYFCYSKGLLTADTRKMSDGGTSKLNAVPTIVADTYGMRLLSDISADEKGEYLVKLRTPQNLIRLYFSDFAYVGSDKLRYEYSVDSGKTWIRMPDDMTVTFSNLDGKDLELSIRQMGSTHTEIMIHVANGPYSGERVGWWVIIAIAILSIAVPVTTVIRIRNNVRIHPSSVDLYDLPNNPVEDGGIVDADLASYANQAAVESDLTETKLSDVQSVETDTDGSKSETPDIMTVKPDSEDNGIAQSDENDSENKVIDNEKNKSTDAKVEASKKYSTIVIPNSECEEIAGKLKAWLEESKAYTNPNLKINEVSNAIGVSPHRLSYVFSQYLKTNYYDYIYFYRVNEFKRLAEADTKRTYSLIALSEMAGFNSRATFFRAFKKQEGVTPGDYMKGLRVS